MVKNIKKKKANKNLSVAIEFSGSEVGSNQRHLKGKSDRTMRVEVSL